MSEEKLHAEDNSATTQAPKPIVRQLGTVEYNSTYQRMLDFTEQRREQTTPDEIWICEHPPVYTLGQASKAEHVLHANAIPVVQSNRGGQVTYHGPGQIVAYPLLNLKQRGFFVKELVFRLESAAIATLEQFNITGLRVPGAPGVYVRPHAPDSHERLPDDLKQNPVPPQQLGLAKICALGIKVSRGYSYHGIALNVAMDTQPFLDINPCGYAGLRTVDMHQIGVTAPVDEVRTIFAEKLVAFLR